MSNVHLILGEHPGKLTVRLVREDGMVLIATRVDENDQPVDWPAAPMLEFAPSYRRTLILATKTAVVDGATATWDLLASDVESLAEGSTGPLGRSPATRVRLLLPDAHDEPHSHFAGSVEWRDSWSAGSRTQRISFTVPGSGGGSSEQAVRRDLGSVGSSLIIDEPGSYDFDFAGAVAVTVNTTGDVSLRGHGNGTITVSGNAFPIDGLGVILVVSWARGQDSYMVGAGGGGEAPVDPSDTTPPTAGTLTATGGVGQVSLAVAGATDETALHAAPYAFSVDGGSNFGAWQAGSSATITGLSAGTVTCRHQVRDAAGNISLGATKTATVTAPTAPVSITENFTAADTTNLIGKATTTGGKTWLQDTTGANALGGGQATVPITNNRLQSTGPGLAARIDVGTPIARVKATFSSGNGRMALFVAATSDVDCVTAHIIPGNGTKIWSNTGAAELVSIPGAIDAGDVFELTYDGTTATVTRNGEVRASVAISGKTGTNAGVGILGENLWLDNAEIAAL